VPIVCVRGHKLIQFGIPPQNIPWVCAYLFDHFAKVKRERKRIFWKGPVFPYEIHIRREPKRPMDHSFAWRHNQDLIQWVIFPFFLLIEERHRYYYPTSIYACTLLLSLILIPLQERQQLAQLLTEMKAKHSSKFSLSLLLCAVLCCVVLFCVFFVCYIMWCILFLFSFTT
jgi:hypothetical protein